MIQPEPENFFFLNDRWHTDNLRQASASLTWNVADAFQTLAPSVTSEVYPEMDGDLATKLTRRQLIYALIPNRLRYSWEQSESTALRFFTTLPVSNSPGRIDSRIVGSMDQFVAFASGRDVHYYLELTDRRIKRLLDAAPETGKGNPLTLLVDAYIESRILRFATQGRYLVRPGTFIAVEDPT